MLLQFFLGLIFAILFVVFILTPIILVFYFFKNRKIKKKYKKMLKTMEKEIETAKRQEKIANAMKGGNEITID